ncbi:AlpA family transcriptional regulator [Robbsia andropogonis]|uniref:AlpA family transcriptional regulator n=1 Tax=Robbsia andropogonis TaxID=28092 RepID=A0A0F5JXG5_9BURK|nr:AlpA family phage regulatory protein [Robbsia andropogonis]KKB62395.1 AlpA family transcriptional regulator [Robbsia andropogonis]
MTEQINMAQTILRRPQVKTATGLSTSTIYDRIKRKTFPAPIRLGVRSVGWRAGDIEAFLASPSTYRAEG